MTLTDEATALERAERLTTLGAALRRTLDGEYARQARGRSERLSGKQHAHGSRSSAWTRARHWTLKRLHELADAGFGSAGVPERAGGAGRPARRRGDLRDPGTWRHVRHDQVGSAIRPVWRARSTNLGTEWHHDTFLPDITSMKFLGGFAMTELGHGSDVASIETEITSTTLIPTNTS